MVYTYILISFVKQKTLTYNITCWTVVCNLRYQIVCYFININNMLDVFFRVQLWWKLSNQMQFYITYEIVTDIISFYQEMLNYVRLDVSLKNPLWKKSILYI